MKTFDSFRSLTSLRYLPALTKQFIPNGAKRTMCRAVDNVPNQTGEFRLGIEIPVSIKTLNVADRELLLVLPDPDKVMDMYINLNQGDRDPYWTVPWPSAVCASEHIFQRPNLVSNQRIAELGAGLGLAGLSSALAGAQHVTLLDREPLALQCICLNALINGVHVVDSDTFTLDLADLMSCLSQEDQTRVLSHMQKSVVISSLNNNISKSSISVELYNWLNPRELSSEMERYDMVLCCDVLYETFSVRPVTQVLSCLLRKTTDTARVLLADPPDRARKNRDTFMELLRSSFTTEECSQKMAREEGGSTDVPILIMLLKRGALGDTIGVRKKSDLHDI